MGAAAETQTHLERATAALGRNVATLTIPERALIVAESLEAPVDPVRFADEWGLERTSTQRHFRRMAELGFLRVIGDGPSTGGRRPVLYSATQNLLYRGRDWEELSQEDRQGHSFVVFITLMSRISLAMNAQTLDREVDRHFTWKALEIDRLTWDELMRRLDDVLDWVIAAEADAIARNGGVGGGLFPATAALAGFRSPTRAELRDALVGGEAASGYSAGAETQQRLKRAAIASGPEEAKLVIPERALILSESLEAAISPSRMAREWGLKLRQTAKSFERMEKAGFLERLDEREAPGVAADGSRRGRGLDLYVGTQNLLYRLAEWEKLPRGVREGHSFVVFVTLMARISLSLNAGTMDRDIDRHFTWKAVEIDRPTWNELIRRLDDVLFWVMEAENEAKERLERFGGESITATVALAGFRSPERSEILPPRDQTR